MITRKEGIDAEADELGNVLVNSQAPVIMNGHLDVVAPAGDADYQPKLREGTIVGRGTTDMKGGIAVMMEVMKKLHSKYPGLGAVFQVTEESEYVKSGADILCERGVFDKTKFVIEGEGSVDPSSGKTHVIVGCEVAYDWSTKITTDESPYHAGRLHLANNAILVGMRYVEHRGLRLVAKASSMWASLTEVRKQPGHLTIAKSNLKNDCSLAKHGKTLRTTEGSIRSVR
jgi:acetylornithine deacetylase/succinyl-diaminopimelate desuccinylase-like protein